MGAISNAIGNNIADAFGSYSGTNLEDFLSKFKGTKLVDQIDPLATFDVSFKFYPSIDPIADDASWLKKLGRSIANNAIDMANNLVDKLSFGFAGLDYGENNLLHKRKKFEHVGKHTFMEYVADGNSMVAETSNTSVFNKLGDMKLPLELQLGFYIQTITVPRMTMLGESKATTVVGEIPINGLFVQSDNNKLMMDVINTKLPLIERIFYPWMREVTLPYWSYEKQPYTTATITIDFRKHADIQYIFYGCRPTNLDLIQPTQEPNTSITRQVQFTFDFMSISSTELPVTESWMSKLLSEGGTLLNNVTNMVNF